LRMTGQKARILVFVTAAGRCPAADFLKEAPRHLRKRFMRAFGLLVREGLSTATSVRQFKPLSNGGTGLWSWKEHDQRLYAFRGRNAGDRVQFVLLCGWTKDKDAGVSGSNEERNQIAKALALRDVCYSLPDTVWQLSDAVGSEMSGPPSVAPDLQYQQEEPVEQETVQQSDPGTTLPTKKPGETVNLSELAKLSGINDKTLWHWVARTHVLEAPPRVNGRYAWKWEDVDAVVAKIHEIGKTSPSRAVQAASSGVVPASAPFLSSCTEIPEPVDPKVAQEPVVLTAAVERFGVPTRFKLLKLAEEVVDGKRMVSEFTDAASRYRQEVERLEMELRMLRGE
jgi:hypothetical protein